MVVQQKGSPIPEGERARQRPSLLWAGTKPRSVRYHLHVCGLGRLYSDRVSVPRKALPQVKDSIAFRRFPALSAVFPMQCVCFQVLERPGARFPHPWPGRSCFYQPSRQEFTLCLRTSTGRPSSSTADRLRRALVRMSSLRPRERYGRMVLWAPRKTSKYFLTCRQSFSSANDIS